MSISFDMVKDFIDYLEYYPEEDEPDFDGVHFGGMKGLRSDAPESAIKAWKEYTAMLKEAENKGFKL